jgi:hypothetical protein
MGIWKARLMALLGMVAMLVALSAPVALADSDDRCRIGDDRVVCRDDGDEEVFTQNELENELLDDGTFDDGDEFFLSGLDDDDFHGLGFGFEFEDIDCDEIEDDDDPVFDEGLCEVEGEFLGEDVEFLVEADELFDF